MKWLMNLIPALLITYLSACSSNPLINKPAEETARLLMKTSEEALAILNSNAMNKGDYYRLCMENVSSIQPFDCQRFYELMAIVLASQQIGISVAQLTNQQFYKSLQKDLKQLSYFSL